jgi:hypothetical protein
MAVLFVLTMFLVFALIDWVLTRGKAAVEDPAAETVPVRDGEYAYGFHLPNRLRYHPGHGWALRERKNVIRVGISDFAARLAGRIDAIELPQPGQW